MPLSTSTPNIEENIVPFKIFTHKSYENVQNWNKSPKGKWVSHYLYISVPAKTNIKAESDNRRVAADLVSRALIHQKYS